MKAFLRYLFDDTISAERRLVIFTAPRIQSRLFADVDDAVAFAADQARSQDVYFGLGLIAGEPRGRGRLDDIAALGALWADIDLAGEAHPGKSLPTTIDEARSLLADLPLAPSMVIDSGHGVHAYWLLDRPWLLNSPDDRSRATTFSKGWHAAVCAAAAGRGWSLENLGDPTRVLRLPGTINHKRPEHPVAVRVIECLPEIRYTLDDVRPHLVEVATAPRAASACSLSLQPSAEPPADRFVEAFTSSLQFRQTWERQREDLQDTSQSGYDLSLATMAAMRSWSDQEIANLIIAARRRHDQNPAKALRGDYVQRTIERARAAAVQPEQAAEVDLSGLLTTPAEPAEESAEPKVVNPGPIPERLFQVPGFVTQVMEFTLAKAPYPNLCLAFCGAMALQSFLAARKVCTPGDLRSNIYLLALASSGLGKDFPRKVNSRVLLEIGLVNALGDKFASGEGIQDALIRSNAMLFQNDEMDGVLRQINLDRENKRESIPNILLTLYTSANDIYPIRVKAGRKEAVHIDQPHLTLFGTATRECFYESLSQRMLTNGFFARMIVIDAGKRAQGQVSGSAREVPESILQTARWWADFQPGGRAANLLAMHPQPRVVPFEPEAAEAVLQLQRMTEAEYERADVANDEVARTAWSRTCENAQKQALIYACSENHETPVISLPAVEWATAFAMHQTRRQLYLAQRYVAENPFHAECLKLLRKLEEAEGRLPRRQLMRDMRCKAADFDQIVNTLLQQGDIVALEIPTKTKPAQGYRLT